MPRNDVRSVLTSHLGPHRLTAQVLGAAAGPPVSVSTAFQLPVNPFISMDDPPVQSSSSAANDVASQVAQLNNELSHLRASQETNISGLAANTVALGLNTASKASGENPVLTNIESLAGNALTSGFGLSPILSGLISLFGGASSPAPAPLLKFALPPAIQYEGGLIGGANGYVAPVAYNQSGQPRLSAQAPAPQLNIQVSAMDSKSFLDHSDEIAQAVRKALLNSNSLSDVIADL